MSRRQTGLLACRWASCKANQEEDDHETHTGQIRYFGVFSWWYVSEDQLPKLYLSAKLGKLSGSVCTYARVNAKHVGKYA